MQLTLNNSTTGTSALVDGCIVQGHQIASGLAPDSPYPDGSIPLQMPFFKESGLDLAGFYPGTLNVSIAPKKFVLSEATYRFEQVRWIDGFAPETFSFCDCAIEFDQKIFQGYVYYPHPETKTQHFHNDSLLEVICPLIEGIQYGDRVKLHYLSKQIDII